jgi:penicillin-binding protein 1A
MSSSPEYVPPRVWTWNKENGGQFANINRPIAGATHDRELPVGRHPLQLYSLGTPNGVKVTIMLEELLALGHEGAEYDAWLIKIGDGDQFGSGFVAINPNSKIPALLDRSFPTPVRVFESGAILLHLAERFGAFLPADPAARAREVLNAMAETGAIPAEQARAAASQIAALPRPVRAAGWFSDWVSEQADPLLPDGADATIRTTLDTRIQATVETRLKSLLEGPGAEANVTQGAVVVLDAQTGNVRALVGGRDYRASPFNRAVVARRQPGSAFKPFVWLAAIEAGARPDDTVLDAPIRRGTWSPGNFDNRFRGEITLEEALAQSVNTAAVRLLIQAGGPRPVAAAAARLGIADRLPNNESLALGTAEVGLLELTAAYAGFFNGGLRITPTGIDALASEGRTIALTRPAPPRVIDPDHAAMMARMLSAVVARGSGRAAAIPGRATAGKTGTTQDNRDAWFIGWTDAGRPGGRMIGIWLGNDDNRPMNNVTGGGLPTRLFADIVRDLGAN